MEQDKPIKGFENACLYFDSFKSRFPLRICIICGQPVKPGTSKISLTETKTDRRRISYNRIIKSKTLEVFHMKCKNKLIKRITKEDKK